jgi:hypothetical protein
LLGFTGVAGLGWAPCRRTTDVDHALGVANRDVLALDAEIAPQVETGNGGSAGAGTNDLDFVNLLADDFQAVEHGGGRNDRRAVLVVVEDGDIHPLFELLFNVEALRRLDVFKVDAAERRLHRGDHVDQLVRVVLGQFDVEDVDTGEFLEQTALAFHHRLGGQRADVAEAEHGGAVGDHADQVGARGVLRRRWPDLRRSHRRRRQRPASSQRQIALVGQALGRR